MNARNPHRPRKRATVGPRGTGGKLWTRHSRSGLFVPVADKNYEPPKPWRRLKSGLWVPPDFRRSRPSWVTQ